MAQTKQRKQFNLPEDLDDDESQIQVKHLYVFPKKMQELLVTLAHLHSSVHLLAHQRSCRDQQYSADWSKCARKAELDVFYKCTNNVN